MAGNLERLRGRAQGPVMMMLAVMLTLFALVGAAVPTMALAEDMPAAPGATKEVTPNDDGTYTVSLSVTGKEGSSTETTSKKIDVVLVMDTSGSMGESMGRNQGTRLENAKTSAKLLVNNLIGENTTGDVQIAVVSFAADANVKQGYTSDKTLLDNAIDSLWANDGTNWDAGLKEANDLGSREGAEKYIVFLSDGDPTYSLKRKDKQSGKELSYDEDSDRWYYITWSLSNGRGKQHYVDANNIEVTNSRTGTGSNYSERHLAAAVDQASRRGGAKLFSVALTGQTETDLFNRMQEFQRKATGSGDGCFSASSSEELLKAFGEISSTINKSVTFDNVKIADTLSTNVSGVTQGKTELTADGKVDSRTFVYTKNRKTWSDAPAATVAPDDGAITWDLSSIGTLEANTTYTVSFTIAPNQAAFDQAAKEGKELKLTSNGSASVSFKRHETVNGEDSPSDGSINLETGHVWVAPSTLTITKQWSDGNDAHNGQTVNVTVKQDGKSYATVELGGSSNTWSKTINVAGGPTGHTYTIEETAVEGYDTTYSATSLEFKGLKTQKQSVTVTNTRSTGTLCLTKMVSGNAANTGHEFSFVLACNKLAGKSFDAEVVNGDNRKAATTVTFDSNGVSNTITLKHDDRLELTGIPTGYTVSIKETGLDADKAYTSTYAKVGDSESTEVTPQNGATETASVNAAIVKGGVQVTFTNNSTAAPSTGVSGADTTSMAGLLAVAAVGGTALFAASRRKHGQDAWKE